MNVSQHDLPASLSRGDVAWSKKRFDEMQTLESIYQLLFAGDVALATFEVGGWQLLQVHRKVSVDVDGRPHELSAAAHT